MKNFLFAFFCSIFLLFPSSLFAGSARIQLVTVNPDYVYKGTSYIQIKYIYTIQGLSGNKVYFCFRFFQGKKQIHQISKQYFPKGYSDSNDTKPVYSYLTKSTLTSKVSSSAKIRLVGFIYDPGTRKTLSYQNYEFTLAGGGGGEAREAILPPIKATDPIAITANPRRLAKHVPKCRSVDARYSPTPMDWSRLFSTL